MISIRKGGPADIHAALDLIKELAVYEKAEGQVTVTVDQMTEWGFGQRPVFEFIVLEKNEVIIGMALYYPKYSTWKGECVFLEDLIVTASERGRGYGRLLLDEMIRIAKERKAGRLEWQVLSWNSPAIGFYRTYGADFDSEWLNCRLSREQLQSL
jgi:GNAT superfamily N-acetyltransferase